MHRAAAAAAAWRRAVPGVGAMHGVVRRADRDPERVALGAAHAPVHQVYVARPVGGQRLRRAGLGERQPVRVMEACSLRAVGWGVKVVMGHCELGAVGTESLFCARRNDPVRSPGYPEVPDCLR